MLVLTRNEGECILVGDDIKITLVMVERGRARIGIEAPKDLPIHREEIYNRIRAGLPLKPPAEPKPSPGPALTARTPRLHRHPTETTALPAHDPRDI